MTTESQGSTPQYKPPEQKGIRCRHCGCTHFETENTKRRDGYIYRLKTCRFCRKQVRTREEPCQNSNGATGSPK